jgi:hypothetical protein
VAEYTPARVQPGGRHVLSPPTRQVAFNQALTRNDGLLVDALRQHLGLPAAEAREALRQAVATLHRDLQTQERTELPGIGVFRQLAGRGLQFEYTGTDNLFTAAFGLPELTVHPVSVIDARLAREQQAQLVPRLRSAGRGVRLRRVVPGAAIGLLAGLAVAGLYLLNLHPAVLPTAWQSHLPRWEQPASQAAPQQAALAQPSFSAPATVASTPVEVAEAPASVPAASPNPSANTEDAVAAPGGTLAAPAASAPVVVAKAPAPTKAQPTQAAPSQTTPAPADPVDALLARRAAPSQVRPRGKARKVPAAAAIALADESNVAKPVPLALRKANTPSLTTSYVVATTAPRPAATPAAVPVVSVHNSKKVALATAAKPAAKAKPVAAYAAKPVAAHAAKPVAAVVPAPAAGAGTTAAAATSATTIKGRTGRYYLIVAAYGSLARAEEGRRNLAHAGRPAKVILPPKGSRLYRLSAVDFADKPTATLAANRLRQNPHFDKGLTVLPY